MTPDAWEATLVALLRTADPGGALDALRAAPDHDPALDAIDRDGLRMAARIVMCLRLDRLLDGDLDAARWYQGDPASFSPTFRRYHLEVPARAYTPSQEAETWRAWLGRR